MTYVSPSTVAWWKSKLYVRVALSLVTLTTIIIIAASTTVKDYEGDIIQPALISCFLIGPSAVVSFILSNVDIAFMLLRHNREGIHSIITRVVDMVLILGWFSCIVVAFVLRAAHPWHEHYGVGFRHEEGDGFFFSSVVLGIIAFGLQIAAFTLTVKQVHAQKRNELLSRKNKPDPNCEIPRIDT